MVCDICREHKCNNKVCGCTCHDIEPEITVLTDNHQEVTIKLFKD